MRRTSNLGAWCRLTRELRFRLFVFQMPAWTHLCGSEATWWSSWTSSWCRTCYHSYVCWSSTTRLETKYTRFSKPNGQDFLHYYASFQILFYMIYKLLNNFPHQGVTSQQDIPGSSPDDLLTFQEQQPPSASSRLLHVIPETKHNRQLVKLAPNTDGHTSGFVQGQLLVGSRRHFLLKESSKIMDVLAQLCIIHCLYQLVTEQTLFY